MWSQKKQPALFESIRGVSQRGWHFLNLFFFKQRLTACKLEIYQVALSKTHQLSTEFGPFLVDVVVFYQFVLISTPFCDSPELSVMLSARRKDPENEPIWRTECIINGAVISSTKGVTTSCLFLVARNKALNSKFQSIGKPSMHLSSEITNEKHCLCGDRPSNGESLSSYHAFLMASMCAI